MALSFIDSVIEQSSMLKIILTCIFLLLLLTSCALTTGEYPNNWSPQKSSHSSDECPEIAGVYSEWGNVDGDCSPFEEACKSLSYNLLSGNIGYKQVMDESSTPRLPVGDLLELRQPANNRLEIIQWRTCRHSIHGVYEYVLDPVHGNCEYRLRKDTEREHREDQKQIISKKTLSMEDGDFSCGPDGLTLTRALYFLWGISNLVGSVSRSFNTSEDGSLILKSTLNYMGHHVIIPGAYNRVTWMRWLPATKELIDE